MKIRKKDLVVLLGIILTLLGITFSETTKDNVVVKVVDGDTIDVRLNGKTERIRLIGVNTPETVDPRKQVECFGKEASNFTKKMLSGKTVSLEEDLSQDSTDRYGRLLRFVFVDNQNFNLELVKQGYAYEYTYESPHKYQKEFREAQKYAQENQLGLWSKDACAGQK